MLNLQIAKADLAGTDSGVATRTWQDALNAIIQTKHGATKERWQRGAKDKAMDGLRKKVIIETQAEHLLLALKVGTVSTNIHLRKLHNFCLAMNWLPWPIIRSSPEMFGTWRLSWIEEADMIPAVAQVRFLTLLDDLPNGSAGATLFRVSC